LLLVPVPSARSSTAARGHDPVRRIAAAAARDLRRAGLPAQVLPLLRQRRAVADQSGLGARQRRANLAGALELTAGGGRLLRHELLRHELLRHELHRHELHRHGLLRLGRVILVDDLLTTGSTLAEAARAVGEAGGVGRESSVHGVCRAAVVAASPTAFEINRN
ncbi:ComF family protein, partial [Streptomyces sp. wa1063]|uniref:ComF family protein n=1 Tax=Streptomyces sp. wa1063 TaxID=1828212 RepID=UPI000D1CC287